LPTYFVYVYRVILKTNSDKVLKQHRQVWVWNGNTRSRNMPLEYYLDEIRVSKAVP